jgi:hypothetical protein
MHDRQGGTSAGSRSIRSTGPTDRDWITQFLYDRWAADFVVVHGEVIKPADLPALTCGQGEGLATPLMSRPVDRASQTSRHILSLPQTRN